MESGMHCVSPALILLPGYPRLSVFATGLAPTFEQIPSEQKNKLERTLVGAYQQKRQLCLYV